MCTQVRTQPNIRWHPSKVLITVPMQDVDERAFLGHEYKTIKWKTSKYVNRGCLSVPRDNILTPHANQSIYVMFKRQGETPVFCSTKEVSLLETRSYDGASCSSLGDLKKWLMKDEMFFRRQHWWLSAAKWTDDFDRQGDDDSVQQHRSSLHWTPAYLWLTH